MHRFAVYLIAIASTLVVSTARADLVCGDYMSGDYQPDELPASSQAKAEAARSCVCSAECGAWCFKGDGEGTGACYLNAPSIFFDLGGDVDACELCGDARCHAAINACVTDH